jgi:hypothetical protein
LGSLQKDSSSWQRPFNENVISSPTNVDANTDVHFAQMWARKEVFLLAEMLILNILEQKLKKLLVLCKVPSFKGKGMGPNLSKSYL